MPIPKLNLGAPVDFGGRVNASITSITPAITFSRNTSGTLYAPLFIQASAADTVVNSSDDPWADVEYNWDTDQNDARNTYTHPVHGGPVSLDKDQKGGEALFCFWEPGTYTIGLRCRAWRGATSGWLSATTTEEITVVAFPEDLTKNRFVDSEVTTAGDGYDPWGFNASGAQYDPSTGQLSHATAFAGYTHNPMTWNTRWVAITAAGTGGSALVKLHRILGKSGDNLLLATGLTGAAVTGISTSTGPLKTWNDCYSFISGSEKRLFIATGSDFGMTNSEEVQLANKSHLRLHAYGNPTNGRPAVAATASITDAILRCNVGSGAASDIVVSGIAMNSGAYAQRVAFFREAPNTPPARAIRDVYLYDCDLIGGTEAQINAQRTYGFGYIRCRFDVPEGIANRHGVYNEQCDFISSVGNEFSGGGDSTTLDHHEYTKAARHYLARWNPYGSSDVRSYCINGDYDFDEFPQEICRYWVIDGCFLHGTGNGVDLSDNDNKALEGFQDTVVQWCKFRLRQVDVAQQGHGLTSYSPGRVHLRDLIFWGCWRHDIHIGRSMSSSLPGTSRVFMYRLVSWAERLGQGVLPVNIRLWTGAGSLTGSSFQRDPTDNANPIVVQCQLNGDPPTTPPPPHPYFCGGNNYFAGTSTVRFQQITADLPPPPTWPSPVSLTTWQSYDQEPSTTENDPDFEDPENGQFLKRITISALTTNEDRVVVLDGGSEDLGVLAKDAYAEVHRRIWNNGTEPIEITAISTTGDGNAISVVPPILLYPGRWTGLTLLPDTSATGTKQMGLSISHDNSATSPFTASFDFEVV